MKIRLFDSQSFTILFLGQLALSGYNFLAGYWMFTLIGIVGSALALKASWQEEEREERHLLR